MAPDSSIIGSSVIKFITCKTLGTYGRGEEYGVRFPIRLAVIDIQFMELTFLEAYTEDNKEPICIDGVWLTKTIFWFKGITNVTHGTLWVAIHQISSMPEKVRSVGASRGGNGSTLGEVFRVDAPARTGARAPIFADDVTSIELLVRSVQKGT